VLNGTGQLQGTYSVSSATRPSAEELQKAGPTTHTHLKRPARMVPDYLQRTQAVLCYMSGWRRAWNRVEGTPPPHTRSIRLDLLENALHSIRRVGQHRFLSILCMHLPPPASIIALFEYVVLADIFECGMVAGFQRLFLQAISASPLCLDLSSTRYEGSIIRCFDYVAVFCFVFWYCQCTVNLAQDSCAVLLLQLDSWPGRLPTDRW
jgi:hypothetical protein